MSTNFLIARGESSTAVGYRLVGSADWEAFLRHFELSSGFAFLVVLPPDRFGAEVCRSALAAKLENFKFTSVTQDEDGYIYVLAIRPQNGTSTPFEARLLRFAPEGGYLSQSNITGTGSTKINNAYGIAYTPSSPQEIHALIQIGTNYFSNE